ncbi:MAG TPA: hypothetical protein VF912_10380 [Anaeromyxobacter sp.]
MIAFTLAIALAAAARPAAHEPAKAAQKPPAEAEPKAGGARPAAEGPPVDVPVDDDVMGFLSLGQSTAARDGAVKLPWDGPGGPQMKLSWDALERRNEQLALGDMMARSLMEAVRTFYDTEGGLDPESMKSKLKKLVGAPMDEARTAYLDAITWEDRRLFFVERAMAQADAESSPLPGIEPALVKRRAAAIRSGAVKKALGVRVDGYRDLALGLVAYLDGDNFGALQRVRSAAQALPDFAVAHAFLGSIYFLFDQKEPAVAAWRRALELDPTNKAVEDALKEHGRPKRQTQTSK